MSIKVLKTLVSASFHAALHVAAGTANVIKTGIPFHAALHVAAGTANVIKTGIELGGTLVCAVMAIDSIVHLDKTISPLHQLNPCGRAINFPTILNVQTTFSLADCPDIPSSEIQNIFDKQVLLLPVVTASFLLLHHTFGKIESGLNYWNDQF